DEAALSISSGSAPFTGSFRPQGGLSAFDGKNVSGTWTLTITDQFSGDSGTLHSWGLEINPAATYTNSTAAFIPPSGTAGITTSTITIPDSFLIQDVNVLLDLSHTWDSDLRVSLQGPDGTSVLLFN